MRGYKAENKTALNRRVLSWMGISELRERERERRICVYFCVYGILMGVINQVQTPKKCENSMPLHSLYHVQCA